MLIFLFAISSGSGRRNSIRLLFLTSSSVILLGFSSELDVRNFSKVASAGRYAPFFETLKKSTFTLLLLLHFAFQSAGQSNLLWPAPELSKSRQAERNYYDTLFPLLFKRFSAKPYARYWVSVSFGKEYAFSVEEINGKYFILSNSLSSSVWYTRGVKKIKVFTSSQEIEYELYCAIGRLFGKLTAQLETLDTLPAGSDGNIYYFQCSPASGKILTGKTWSPADKTFLGELVLMSDRLYKVGLGETYENDLLPAITQITQRVN